MAVKNTYPLTNISTGRIVTNKNTRFCPKADRVIGEPLSDYGEAKQLAVTESQNDVKVMLEYFNGESREFTEFYFNGVMVNRIEKRVKKIEE